MFGLGTSAVFGRALLQGFDDVLRDVANEELGHTNLHNVLSYASSSETPNPRPGWHGCGRGVRYHTSRCPPLAIGERFCCDQDRFGCAITAPPSLFPPPSRIRSPCSAAPITSPTVAWRRRCIWHCI